MSIEDVVNIALRRAYGFSKNAQYRFSYNNAFFRKDEIAKAISKNIMLVIADTYYITYTENLDRNYVVVVGGTDDVVELAMYAKHNFVKFVEIVTGHDFEIGLEKLLNNPEEFQFVVAYARF